MLIKYISDLFETKSKHIGPKPVNSALKAPEAKDDLKIVREIYKIFGAENIEKITRISDGEIIYPKPKNNQR
ncbi:MAG: hypothetical protein M0Z72_01295 [Deltaproteobacteria bacterium]|nr:hypothetical protein [Deltaproteobacteria bacterium]